MVKKKASKNVLDYDPLAWLDEAETDSIEEKESNRGAEVKKAASKASAKKAAVKKSVRKKSNP